MPPTCGSGAGKKGPNTPLRELDVFTAPPAGPGVKGEGENEVLTLLSLIINKSKCIY